VIFLTIFVIDLKLCLFIAMVHISARGKRGNSAAHGRKKTLAANLRVQLADIYFQY